MVLPSGLRAGVGDRAPGLSAARAALALPGQLRVAPPSRLPGAGAARWLREPGSHPLPDALRLLELLADACEETRR